MNDSLKATWADQNIPEEFLNRLERLSQSVTSLKSQTIFSKLKRFLYFEMILGTLFCFLILKMASSTQAPYLVFFSFLIYSMFLALFYFNFKSNTETAFTLDIKSALEHVISLLKGFIKRLKIISLIANPVLMTVAVLAKLTKPEDVKLWSIPLELAAILLGIIVLFSVAGHLFLTKTILPLTYEKWLKEYQGLYKELTEE